MVTFWDVVAFMAVPFAFIGLLSWSCCAAGGRADRDMGIDQ